MTTYTGRPTTKGGKAVFIQSRGGKAKWGAQSPPTTTQSGHSSSSSPAPPSPSSAANKEIILSEADLKNMHDRMLFLLSNMIGLKVEVAVKNGSKYQGFFHTAFTEGDLGVVLRLAKPVSGQDKKKDVPLTKQIIILAKDCTAINVVGVDFLPQERPGPERGEREGFKTDTDISRSGDIRERDLKKWAPEEHTAFLDIEGDLGDGHHNGRAGWDQFAANERLFGVKTDFNEELYTTKLDRSGADFKAREQQAIQIANEIQQSVSNNVHLREERGLTVDDSGLDEEDLYGAVVRDPLPASNKYMPPAMRRQQELSQQKRPSTPSQQTGRPLPAPAQSTSSIHTAAQVSRSAQQSTSLAQLTQSSQPQKSFSTDQMPSSSTAAVEAAVPVAKPAEGASVGRSNSTKGGNPQFNLNDLRTHNPVSTLLNAATIQGSKNQQIPEHAVDSKQIEDNLAKFAMTARTFATNDKALVNQTKIGLTQRRTELLQKEKDGLAAELKQFGKELTKKLNTPVPDDVKEIFGKKNEQSATVEKTKESSPAELSEKDMDRNKDEDKGKEEKEKGKEKSDTETKDAKADSTNAPTTSTATSSSAGKPVDGRTNSGGSFKFNVKASVFKPNVNAAPFTPSFAVGDKKAGPGGPGIPDKNMFFGKVVTNRYEEDMMFSQGIGQHGANTVGSYYAMSAYNYGPSGQFGPPPMTMAGPNHMVPFIATTGPVPFSQPTPPPGMPHTGTGPGFPQMALTSAPHYTTQGFPPGRSGMIPHMAMYAYPPAAHGGHVMMRYPPPEMMSPMGPNGMMMHPRPLGMEPQMMHYPPSGREQAVNEDVTPDTTSTN
ncbi:hypothetical protein BGZ54_002098 [Gamsiella multidivaricata]|nr:hypothetical protein BGZ54_002098 [Gamsiella multidivaricata]